jgi:hypothetical protein
MIKSEAETLRRAGGYTEEPNPKAAKPMEGSVRQKTITWDGEEFDVVLKFRGSRWVVMGSENDLTDDREDGIIKNMAKIPELIPEADKLFDNGFNVLLIGLHGTGKTASIQDMVARRGLKMKYFSCSTLDPFTDLVGIPVPVDQLDAEGNPVIDEYGNTKQVLKNVRPREVDEADIIFFDELNRADAKTLNAVFEIIQFRSINGEKLENLKVCWAAINPPGEDYDVDRLDEALLDRFDLYVKVDAQPSVSYMSQFIAPQYAKALAQWWSGHDVEMRKGSKDKKADYISPRRLLKLGQIYEAFGNARMVHMALPQGGDFDKTKLMDLLRAAKKNIDNQVGGEIDPEDVDDELDGEGGDSDLGREPYKGFVYKHDWLLANKAEVVEFLEKHPKHYETHTEIVKVLSNKIGGEPLISQFHEVLERLDPKMVEGMVSGFRAEKVSFMRESFKKLHADNPTVAESEPNIAQVLGGSKHFDWV